MVDNQEGLSRLSGFLALALALWQISSGKTWKGLSFSDSPIWFSISQGLLLMIGITGILWRFYGPGLEGVVHALICFVASIAVVYFLSIIRASFTNKGTFASPQKPDGLSEFVREQVLAALVKQALEDKPWKIISAEVMKTHGISIEDVEDQVKFWRGR